MNRAEHHLTCLAEEGAEIAQRATKALRFGLSEIQDGQRLTNAKRLIDEVKDLLCVLHIIGGYDGRICGWQPTREDVEAKRAKIEKFMKISIEQGVLQDDET